MKKILIVVIFFMILLLSSIFSGNDLVKTSATYNTEDISRIVVDLDKADVNIIAADIDKVQVETSSNAHTADAESYFSYVDNGTLYIENYVTKENFLINPKTKINIYIPLDANIEKLEVNLKQGSVSLTDVVFQLANINGEDVNVNIKNSNIEVLNIWTLFGKIAIDQTNATKVNINCTKANVKINHLVSNAISINSVDKTIIEYTNSSVSTFNTTGEDIKISMNLYDVYDYTITTDIPFENSAFTASGNTYTYDSTEQDGTTEFFFEDTEIQEIIFSKK